MSDADVTRLAMLSVHTSPLAMLGGKKTGGMNVYVRALSRELGRRGIAVDVFTRRTAPDDAPTVPLGERARVVHLPAGPSVPLAPSAIYPHVGTFAREVLSFAAREGVDYDLIYSHYWLSGCVANTLRQRWGVPVVQMFHTLGHMKNRVALNARQTEQDVRIATESAIMAWADRLIAATPAERAQLLWLYRADRRKITVVPPGVDLERFHPIPQAEARAQIGVRQDGYLLLFVGRIEPLKAVDSLLQALALLRTERPQLAEAICTLVVGGSGETASTDAETRRLMALRERLDVRQRVRFLGARSQEALPAFYAAADALIMPSDYESFGMVALEAMACGTPVIASEIGGLAFLVRHNVNGFHIPTRDPAALARRIACILTHPERRAELGRAARVTALEYGWDRVADRLLRVFREVRNRKKTTGTLAASLSVCDE